MGYRQAVRHSTLTAAVVGSNPTSPVYEKRANVPSERSLFLRLQKIIKNKNGTYPEKGGAVFAIFYSPRMDK